MTALRLRSSTPVDDAADFGRRVRDIAADGTAQLVRRADVPHLVEVGRETATTAVSDAMDRVAGRRRRRRPNPVLLVAIAVTLGLGAWWLVRMSGLTNLRTIGEDEGDDDLGATVEQALDANALSRATNEGMGLAAVGSIEPHGRPSELRYPAGDPGAVGTDPF